MRESHKWLTAFNSRYGQFKYLVMPVRTYANLTRYTADLRPDHLRLLNKGCAVIASVYYMRKRRMRGTL